MVKKKLSGFSLVEVLIFVTVITVFFIAAASISSVSVQVTKSNQAKILGTRYAEALMEWLRGEKEADWSAFTGRLGCYPSYPCSNSWCFNQTTIEDATGWTDADNAPCSTYGIQNIYKRDLKISTTSNPDELTAEVTVSWKEGTHVVTVPVNTVFSRFE